MFNKKFLTSLHHEFLHLRKTRFGIIIGFFLFLLSIITLFVNDGRIDYITLFQKAPIFGWNDVIPDTFSHQLVILQGNLSTHTGIWDMYLKPNLYLSFSRKVEIYSWFEHITSKRNIDLWGVESSDHTYTYTKDWTETPEDSISYKIQDGHSNNELEVKSISKTNSNISLWKFRVDAQSLTLPTPDYIELWPDNIQIPENWYFTWGYLYITKNGWTLNTPQIGDIRISYTANSSPENNIFLVWKYTPTEKLISAYPVGFNQSFYEAYEWDKESILTELSARSNTSYWELRVIGFVIMVAWLFLFPFPVTLSTQLFSSSEIKNISFPLLNFAFSWLLTLFTILISSISKNFIVLLISYAVIIVVIIAFIRRKQLFQLIQK